MERQRQITQNIDTAAGGMDGIVFLPDGTISPLEIVNEAVEMQLPSRVKGVPRIVTGRQDYLIAPRSYETLDALIEAERHSSPWRPEQNDGWELKHIPEDVRAVCTEWEEANMYPAKEDIAAAAREVSMKRDNRMSVTHACPHCPSETRYACRISGWARELYRYPLIELEDIADGQKYEVPLDAALYIVTTPEAAEYGVDYKIDPYRGRLSAQRNISIVPATLSRDYVIAATEGRSVPVSNELVLQNKKRLAQVDLTLDDWYEVRPEHLKAKAAPEYTAPEIIEALQDKIMLTYAERVDETDYNTMLELLQQELGRRGLGLIFNVEYCGMGETQMAASSYYPEKRRKRDIATGMDSADIIKKLHQQLDKNTTKE